MSESNMLFNEREYDELIEQLNSSAKPKRGIVLAIILGIAGAVLWSVVAKVTGYTIGFMAIGVGYLVSIGFSKAGLSTNQNYGIIAGLIALLSIFLGEIFTTIIFLAEYMQVSIIESISYIDLTMLPSVVFESMNMTSILFYAIGLKAAYSRSFIDENKINAIIESKMQSREAA